MTNPLPVVDRDDLVAALDSGLARRALLEDLADEYPRTGVGTRAQAEADELALTEQRTVLVARREKAEEAVLALRAGRGGQLVKELRRRRELRQVDARGQQVIEVVPVAGRGEHPLLLRGHTAGVVPAAAAAPAAAGGGEDPYGERRQHRPAQRARSPGILDLHRRSITNTQRGMPLQVSAPASGVFTYHGQSLQRDELMH